VIKHFSDNLYPFFGHKMLQRARENASDHDEIKTILLKCKSLIESIEAMNEKRVSYILKSNPDSVYDVIGNENIKQLIEQQLKGKIY